MNIDKFFIMQQITSKNKKRKNQKHKCKNRYKTIKISYRNLKTTNLSSLYAKYTQKIPDIYPLINLKNKNKTLIDVAIFCENKINSQIVAFRGVKNTTFIDFIAKDCVFYCVKNNITDFIGYINKNYGFVNLQAKEKQILPYLIIKYLYLALITLLKNTLIIERDITVGARLNNFIFWQKYSPARVYGIAKYNKNLLKYITISQANITKCVFNFLSKLNNYQIKINSIIKLIEKVLPYMSQSKKVVQAKLNVKNIQN